MKTLTKRFKGFDVPHQCEDDVDPRASHADKPVQCAGVDLTRLCSRTMAARAAKLVWIQLAKCGSFRGHPSGPFELTPQIFSEIVANFRATQNKRIPIDFEHASGKTPRKAQSLRKAHPRKAGSSIWTTAEWPVFGACRMARAAADLHQTGQIQVFSPAIRFRLKGSRIGPTHWRTDDEWRSDKQPFSRRDDRPCCIGSRHGKPVDNTETTMTGKRVYAQHGRNGAKAARMFVRAWHTRQQWGRWPNATMLLSARSVG